jgi:hypothetical protein
MTTMMAEPITGWLPGGAEPATNSNRMRDPRKDAGEPPTVNLLDRVLLATRSEYGSSARRFPHRQPGSVLVYGRASPGRDLAFPLGEAR